MQEFGLPRWLSGKNLLANAGDVGDASWIPGSGKTHSSILAWEIPWIGYSPWGSQTWTQLRG